MKQLIVLCLLSLLALTGLSAQGSSALSRLSKDKFSGSNSAMQPKTPKAKDKKKSLSGHERPDQFENSDVGEAYGALEDDNWDAAIEQLDDFAQTDADAAFGLGLAYYEKDMLDAAEDALLHALELDPEYTDALYLLGLIYAEAGNYDLAEDAFIRALNQDPEDADVWYELGYIYYDAGYVDEAEYCLQAALEIDPEYPYTSYE